VPSVSSKQHNFMAAIANSPSFAKKAGVPQSVGSEFVKADKGRKFAKGDGMKKIPPFMGKETKREEAKEMAVKAKSKAKYAMGEAAEGIHGKSGMKKPSKYAQGGFTKAADGIAQKGKTKAQCFAKGGFTKAADGCVTHGRTKAQQFDGGGVVDPNFTAGPPPGRLYQSMPVGRPVPMAPAPMRDPRAERRAARQARIGNRPPMVAAPRPSAPTDNTAAIRALYAGNQTDTRFNPNGPDAAAMKYWDDKIKQSGLAAVQGGMFNKEVKDYEDADFARRTAAMRGGLKKGGEVSPKAYATGGQVKDTKKVAPPPPPKPKPDSEIPSEAREIMRQREKDRAFDKGEEERKKSMGSVFAKGGCVKMARGGGCEVRGKTKGRYI